MENESPLNSMSFIPRLYQSLWQSSFDNKLRCIHLLCILCKQTWPKNTKRYKKAYKWEIDVKENNFWSNMLLHRTWEIYFHFTSAVQMMASYYVPLFFTMFLLYMYHICKHNFLGSLVICESNESRKAESNT